jgi:hypothetical protein
MTDQRHPHDGSRWRLGALGGIAFTILALASTLVVPTAPALDDPADEIRTYLTEHQTRLGISTVLYAVSVLALVAFLATIHRRLGADGRNGTAATTFLVAGTAGVTLGLLGGLVEAVLVQRIAPGAEAATAATWYAVWDIVAFTGPPLAIDLAILVAAVVLHRDRAVPLWLTLAAAGAAVLGTVAVVADLTTETGLPGGLDLAGFLLANVWIVGLSVLTLCGGGRAVAPSSAPHPLVA